MNNLYFLKELQIPYNLHFYNLPLAHYEQLIEEKGLSKINCLLREMMVYYKEDTRISSKIRTIINKLNNISLYESIESDKKCECGFNFLGESYEFCPVCNKQLYNKKKCFYKNIDDSCSINGNDCLHDSNTTCKIYNEK